MHLGLRGEKPATKRLSIDTTKISRFILKNSVINLVSRLGGIMASVLASGTKIREFKPGEAIDF